MAYDDSEVPRPPSPAVLPRLGIMVDSMVQPAWIERALRRIGEAGVGAVVLVVRNASDGSTAAPRSQLASWWRNRDRLVLAAYERMDRRTFGSPDDPLRQVDVSGLLAHVPVIEVVPRQTRVSDFFEDGDVERVRAAHLDVLVRFGFRILRGGILQAAKHGVWSYHHGDHERYRGGPPCFWEVLEGNPVTGTVLQRLTDALDDGQVLYRSYSSTDRFSVTRNRFESYWKGSDFLERALRRLRDEGTAANETRPAVPSAYGHRLYVAPTNREMAAGMARIAWRRLEAKRLALFTRDQWYLAYRRRSGVPGDNREPELAPYRFRPILPPADRFWADPFPVRAEGGDFVLFEDYPYATKKGVISVLEIGPDGPVGDARPVLERDYHLSYPFLFSWRGAHFMMPETADVRRVELYKATRYPFEWTLESVVMDDLPLADCTLAEIGGKWWMFANTAVPGASFWDELHLFHGPTPLGPWTPHRRNPVVSDVRSARPAGTPFFRAGTWFRPSQDCSRAYGGALNIQQVMRLDESEYEERTVGRVLPDWRPNLTGVHTVNALGGLTVIDARRRVRKAPLRSPPDLPRAKGP